MALSIDFDPGMRTPVISEVQSPFPSSGVIFVESPSLLQAITMGALIGGITQVEASLYKVLRETTHSLKSDQVIMAEDVLAGERSQQFKLAHPQIFRPH